MSGRRILVVDDSAETRFVVVDSMKNLGVAVVDQAIDGVRYINNPRGRASDVLHDPYHPLRISIQI
jgi:CheY-like chemotaxis protein